MDGHDLPCKALLLTSLDYSNRTYAMNIQQMISRFSLPLSLLASCALAITPTFAQTSVVTHEPLFNFQSAGGFDRSVSDAGDVNGDGFDDLIVGISFPPGNGNGFSSGNAQVFSGVDGSVLYNFDGDVSGDQFGTSVSGAGDVNGDGFSDLIVGAPRDNPNGLSSGSARVFSGVDGSVLYTFDGDTSGDRFGQSVSGAGDVNGDGFDDLIVGGPEDSNNGDLSGTVRVHSGVDGRVLYSLFGDSPNDRFGVSVSGAGDVNGDGFDDLIVGIPGDDNNGASSGSARVFSGVDGRVLYTFDGDSLFDRFGVSVSGAGDVNGDGFDDLIVGASGDDPNGLSSGSARVFSGVDGRVLYNFDGDMSDGEFGSSVSGAGDVNGDGFDDLIVGAPFDGDFTGSAQVFSGVDGSVLYNFDGDDPNTDPSAGGFGGSVSGAGDVNGDGVADFIVAGIFPGIAGAHFPRVFVSRITLLANPLLGDANRNGVVDFADISPFVAILASGGFLAEADCNQDGFVTFADIRAFIAILQAL